MSATVQMHHAECRSWLTDHIADDMLEFDLVYLDPPFRTQRDFGAFDDRWDSLDRYLSVMGIVLDMLRWRLKSTGSLWLHCDQHASHHLKVLLDGTFGTGCFRNEVIWRYRRWPSKARQLQRMHDTLFWYSREPTGYTFHELFEPLAPSTLSTFGKRRQQADFSSGHRKPSTMDDDSPGAALSDVWDIPIVAPSSHERTGWPTQKPERLLERILLVSTNPGDLVLDPMCGSGTTLAVADRLGRRAIGLDESAEAVKIATERLGRPAQRSLA
jgi:DNA modification methylase